MIKTSETCAVNSFITATNLVVCFDLLNRPGFTISIESLESTLRIIAEKRCALQGMLQYAA